MCYRARVLPKAPLGTSHTIIYSAVRESRARGVPSHHCPCLPSLLPVWDRGRQGCSQIPQPFRRGRRINCLILPVDKLVFCWRGISQMERCLSTAPGAHPLNRPRFVTARRGKNQRIKKSKKPARPLLQDPLETGRINLKATQRYHHPPTNPCATPPYRYLQGFCSSVKQTTAVCITMCESIKQLALFLKVFNILWLLKWKNLSK